MSSIIYITAIDPMILIRLFAKVCSVNLHNIGFDYRYLIINSIFSVKIVSNYHHILISQNVCHQIRCLETETKVSYDQYYRRYSCIN